MTINRWFATLERFLTVSSVPELTHLLTQTCRQAGFDSVVLGLQNRSGAQSTAPRLDASTTISDPWNAHYARRRYYEFDPRIAHCLRSTVPFHWHAGTRYATPEAMRMAREEQDFGASAGIFTPTHNADGRLTVMCAGLRRVPQRATRDVLQHAQPLMPALGAYANEAFLRLMAQPASPKKDVPRLTRREQDCLQWAAAGKTSWEIGQVLHITERTVNFHLGHAMSKLGCHSRQHAIVKALALGWIKL